MYQTRPDVSPLQLTKPPQFSSYDNTPVGHRCGYSRCHQLVYGSQSCHADCAAKLAAEEFDAETQRLKAEREQREKDNPTPKPKKPRKQRRLDSYALSDPIKRAECYLNANLARLKSTIGAAIQESQAYTPLENYPAPLAEIFAPLTEKYQIVWRKVVRQFELPSTRGKLRIVGDTLQLRIEPSYLRKADLVRCDIIGIEYESDNTGLKATVPLDKILLAGYLVRAKRAVPYSEQEIQEIEAFLKRESEHAKQAAESS